MVVLSTELKSYTLKILRHLDWKSEFTKINCNFLQGFSGPGFLHSL